MPTQFKFQLLTLILAIAAHSQTVASSAVFNTFSSVDGELP